MISKEIIEKLSAEEIDNILQEVKNSALPSEINYWCTEYRVKIGARSFFTWNWLYNTIRLSNFITTGKDYKDSLELVRFLISMFVIVLDDSADVLQDEKLFSLIAQIPFHDNHESPHHYVQFAILLWYAIQENIQKLPRYQEFKDLFYFDLTQIINTTKYGLLINQYPYLMNKEEYWLYFPTTMQAMLYTTVLLMGSSVEKNQIGKLREVSFFAQQMVRIGNWMSTWERELRERDFTSIVFPYAIEDNLLDLNDILSHKENIFKEIDQTSLYDIMMERLSKEWDYYYHKIEKVSDIHKNMSSYVYTLLPQLEKMLALELASRSIK